MDLDVTVQHILTPEKIELEMSEIERLKEIQPHLKKAGLWVDIIDEVHVMVRAVPQVIKEVDIVALLINLANDVEFYDKTMSDEVKSVHSAIACHASIKAGQEVTVTSMNALLRLMEDTPYFSQCNHGRPTYIKLSHADLNRTFQRDFHRE